MKSLFLLFNHTLTPRQEEDARLNLEVERIVASPPAIEKLWSQIPAELESLACYLEPVRKWLERTATPGDLLLVQGDFGAVCLMVEFARQAGLVPLYSTTRREADEKHLEDGSVRLEHRFRHVRFRYYGH
jgi:hypothetical protein